jgi:oligopeptide transport system substrate-binding protein
MVVPLIGILSIVLSACVGAIPETVVITVESESGEIREVVVTATPSVKQPPVTYDFTDTSDIPTLDPQIAEDVTSINYVENLFVQLTNYDLETSEIIPEAATSWTISDDGLIYTFNLRTDIPWVYHNPVTGGTSQEVDEEGNVRYLNAHDFVYGIKRACDPGIGSYYSSVVGTLIKGCMDVLGAEDPNNVDPALFDAIGVTALDDATLAIELEFPASFFLSMTPMWTLAATPAWAIEEHGENWIEAGNIVTNGRYVLNEWVHGVRRTILRNPWFPADLYGTGNIVLAVTNVVPDITTGYALWLNNQIDFLGRIPGDELETHLAEHPDGTDQVPDLAVFYIAFRMTKPPFDDVRVRQAFSAAYDREAHVEVVEQQQGLVMTHLAPPGIFGAPPIDEVGKGFDPEYARAQLAEAGYPNCEGFPQVSLLGYTGEHTRHWIEFAQAQWEEHLGCDPSLIIIEQQPFAELLAATQAEVPDEDAPHMWTLGWGPDYADENNWVSDVLWCETDNLIVEAREELDPARRIELYRQVEDMFFGENGEFPFFTIYVRVVFVALQPWVDRIPALFGGQQWYNWTIDMDAKLAAQGR